MATREQMLAARERRILRWNVRVNWLGDRVRRNIHMGMEQRLKVTAQLLRDRVVINISIPVVKVKRKITSTDPNTGRKRTTTKTVVTERSKPGEFPRADTTRLMKDIFWELRPEEMAARVGTTLDYGLKLELHMRRSFLRRTLFETQQQIGVIIASPSGGPAGPLPGQDA
jgi:hypothetical protein